MIECPICLQLVDKFKSGSHVIPRWAMKMTKAGGRYASLDLKNEAEPKAARVQSDLICDFWCDSCEKRFRADDAFGARFFRDRVHVIREMLPDSKLGDVGMEIHDPQSLHGLRSFIVSLFLRMEVYGRNAVGKSILGDRFNFYTKAHAAKELDGNNAGLVLFRNMILGESHSSHVRRRIGERICALMVFCGYDVFLISDSRGPEENDYSELVTAREIVIPVYGGTRLPHVKKFVQLIQKIQSNQPGR